MRTKKSKLAQGHIEIILSFVLFIGALAFLFIFINPFAQTSEDSVIENIQNKIINNVSLEIGKLSVVLTNPEDCYNFIPADYPGNYQEAYVSPRKYTIYFGEIFNNVTTKKNPSCTTNQYTLGIYSKEDMIVYERIIGLVSSYNSDYEELKTNLGITGDFVFSFKNLVNAEITQLSVLKNIPVGVDVEANEFPVRVINGSGDIQELRLNIRAWA